MYILKISFIMPYKGNDINNANITLHEIAKDCAHKRFHQRSVATQHTVKLINMNIDYMKESFTWIYQHCANPHFYPKLPTGSTSRFSLASMY